VQSDQQHPCSGLLIAPCLEMPLLHGSTPAYSHMQYEVSVFCMTFLGLAVGLGVRTAAATEHSTWHATEHVPTVCLGCRCGPCHE
jgi:hypothetical protein